MTQAQEWLAKGRCPRCGKEAAPYRLCWDHRSMEMIGRLMKAGIKAGHITVDRENSRGRPLLYGLSDKGRNSNDLWNFRPAFEGKKGSDDKRYRPRLGRVPVDVEREIVGILRAFGRPANVDEIIIAWGRLRETRKTSSLTGDMVELIKAQRRREERNAKRLALFDCGAF
jgi:hypothetical protein